MQTIKHFIKITALLIKQITCKHFDTYESSCPFTGKTYTMCDKCGVRVKETKTI